MTYGQFLSQSSQVLAEAGIATARLDVLILMEDTLKIERAHILAHPERELTTAQEVTLKTNVKRRTQHTPLAYIRGKAMFYGRSFIVTKDVLVPRPETEDIISIAEDLPLKNARIADIGTGSGCIGITLQLELQNAATDLYDISQEALDVARQNTEALGAPVNLFKQDLLSSPQGAYDVIVANLPYVPDHFPINKAAGFEPPLALFAGPDGLDDYKTFWQQVQDLPHTPAYIITESLPSQHHANATLARRANYFLAQTRGFIQLFEAL